jgi:outer membrane protein assembly factor BamB
MRFWHDSTLRPRLQSRRLHREILLLGVFFLGCLLLEATASRALADTWTRFRGPNGQGAVETELPAAFQADDIRFKAQLPGTGHSSPVIWEDLLFVMSADPQTATRYVVCLDANTGEQQWIREYPSQPHTLHQYSSYASCTPAVDESRVYVAWSSPDETTLLALNHDGSDAWQLDLGPWVSQHGFGTSPMLYEDLVILFNSQDGEGAPGVTEPGPAYMLACDRATGREVWRAPRTATTVSYSVPCIYQPEGGEPELIGCQSNEALFSLDPRTGKENWSINVFRMRTVSSPVIAGGLIFGSVGSGGGGNYLVGVRPGKDAEVAYEVRSSAPYVPTSVALGDLLFLWSDGGIVSCLDAATGERHWVERVGGKYFGSPIRAGDKIYCIEEGGTLVTIAADKEFRLLGKTELGEESNSTPTVSGNRMYLRTLSQIICVGKQDS